jgi:hypothetical protein
MDAYTYKIIIGGDWQDKANEVAMLKFILHIHDANSSYEKIK